MASLRWVESLPNTPAHDTAFGAAVGARAARVADGAEEGAAAAGAGAAGAAAAGAGFARAGAPLCAVVVPVAGGLAARCERAGRALFSC